MKVFAEAAVSNIYSANQTHNSHLRLLPIFLIFHERCLKEQPLSSPPDTLFLPPLERVIKPLCRCPPSLSRQCLLSCKEESGNPASFLIRKRLIDSILYSNSNIQAAGKICKTGKRISLCKTKMTKMRGNMKTQMAGQSPQP